MVADRASVEEKTVNTSGRISRRRADAAVARRVTVPVTEAHVEQLQRQRACAALDKALCIMGMTRRISHHEPLFGLRLDRLFDLEREI